MGKREVKKRERDRERERGRERERRGAGSLCSKGPAQAGGSDGSEGAASCEKLSRDADACSALLRDAGSANE